FRVVSLSSPPACRIDSLSLHDALPICIRSGLPTLRHCGLPSLAVRHALQRPLQLLRAPGLSPCLPLPGRRRRNRSERQCSPAVRSEEHTSESSHGSISYAASCLKKKTP